MAETGFQRCLTEEVLHFPTALPGLAAAKQGFLDKSSTSQAMLTDDEYDRGMHRLRSDIEAQMLRATSYSLAPISRSLRLRVG